MAFYPDFAKGWDGGNFKRGAIEARLGSQSGIDVAILESKFLWRVPKIIDERDFVVRHDCLEAMFSPGSFRFYLVLSGVSNRGLMCRFVRIIVSVHG